MTIRDRILAHIQSHPEGADDDQITQTLGLKCPQEANSHCCQLTEEGVVERRRVDGEIRSVLEDRFLQDGLWGHRDYVKHVGHRLLPVAW